MKDVPIKIGGGWQGDYAPNEMPQGGLQTCLNVVPESDRYLPVLRPSTALYTTTSFNPVLTREFPATSIDTLTWTARSTPESNTWYSVTYGNGLFVAVTAAGTYRVMTSPDGVTWTGRTVTASGWVSVTYGNGLFVAVANTGTYRVMTSTDGITWNPYMAAEANNWQGVTYGNGLFVAVAYDGTNRVMTSSNGTAWATASAAEANQWTSITYGNSLFVAVANSGTNRVMTSSNGTAWATASAAEANNWQGVTYGNGLYVAVSSDGTNRVMTSTDGTTWTARAAAAANGWISVVYGNGLYIALSNTGTNKIMSSTDGATWTLRATPDSSNWQDVTYGNGLFVAVSGGTPNAMTASANLIRTENRNFLIDVNGVYYVDYRSNKYTLYSFTYQLDSNTPTPQLEPYKNGIVLRKKGETPQIIRNIFDIVPGVVSITRSGTVATVTVSGAITSQWAVSDKAIIAGCAETEYNGTQTITTIPGSNSFTFTVSGSPATPATTASVITCQFVMSPLGGTPPTATYGTFNNGFHLLGNTNSTNGGKEIKWSRQDNIDDYVADDFPGPGAQTLTDARGDIVGVETIGNRTIVFHQNSITVGDYTGIPDAFTWQQNFSNIGATPSSIVKVNDRVYFYNENDFYVTDGNTVEPLKCGCFNTLFASVNKSGLRNIPISVPSGTHPGFQNDFVIWSFTPSTWFANQTTFLILNIQTGVFAKIVFTDTNMYSLGLTHNEAGTQQYLAAAVWTTAEFGSTAALSLKYLDGTSLAMQFLTGGLTDEEGHMVMRCNGIIPKLYSMTAASVTGKLYAYWQEHSTTNTASTANALNSNGVICQNNVGGKMLTCQIDIAAGETGRVGHTLGLRIGGGGKK